MMIGTSDTVQAFDTTAVGTRVLDKGKFMALLEKAVASFDTSKDTQEGQHFVMLPAEACELVSAGCGKHTGKAEDYVVRMWRGEPSLYLKRQFSEKPTGVAVVVYTRKAYQLDPEVNAERFLKAFPTDEHSHCIVAVLAFAGPKPPVGVSRFVANLAGANNEYDVRHRAHKMAEESADAESTDANNPLITMYAYHLEREIGRLVQLAGEVVEYSRTWCTVAD